jgi:hypothetical protein
MADVIIKKWNGAGWEEHYPKTTVGNIVATGTPSSTTFLRGDGTWSFVPIVTKADLTYIYIYGKAQSAITKGQAVQFAGVQGDHILMKPAVPSEINANPDYFIGLAESTLATDDFGYVLTHGELSGINTSSYTAGSILWFASAGSTAGALTQTEPTGLNARIQVAAVNRTNAGNGIIFVRVHNVGVQVQDIVAGGTTSSTTFLRGDGTWATPASASGDFLPLTGGNITGNLNVSGNVGIGTTAPLDKLHVDVPVGGGDIILTSGTTRAKIGASQDTPGVYIGSFSNNDLFLQTNNATRMTINTSGNVGIGTTSPGERLEVNGKLKFSANSGWGASLIIGGNANSGNSTTGSIGVTNGNLHLDAAAGSFSTLINFYTGTGGVSFGNGAVATVAVMGPDGDLWKGGADNTGSQYWHAGNDGSGSGLDADTVDGYHAGSLWRNDGGAWNPGANISLSQTANGQEWSFDISRNGYTGGYWHVWDSVHSTMLAVNAQTNRVGVRTASPSYVLDVIGDFRTSSRYYSNEWIQMDNYSGLYSPLNNAHFFPNDGSYGPWKIIGSRNGWGGLEFVTSSNGNVSVMVASNATEVGFHNNNVGWQMYWSNGTGYIGKNSIGGGTLAAVLDSANYNGYAPTLTGGNASGTWGINITGNSNSVGGYGLGDIMHYPGWSNENANAQANMRAHFTYSNNSPWTGPLINFGAGSYTLQLNATYGSSDGFSFRTRNGDNGNWNTWRTIIHSGNIGSQSVNYANSAGSASNAVTVDNNTSLNSDSRNTRGVTRVYRRDDNSDFSIQHNWTGAHWHIRGYNGDTFHAEARVGYADSAGSASSATSATSASTANSISTGSSTSIVMNGATRWTFGTNALTPNSVFSHELGTSSLWWLRVSTCGIARNSEFALSDVYMKKDIKKIIIEGNPLYQPTSFPDVKITEQEKEFFEAVKTLFEKINIYTFDYKGHEGSDPTNIGFMAQEIEEILKDYPMLVNLLIENSEEQIKDEEGNVKEIKKFKHLRVDNLDSLMAIMIKHIYFKVKDLEKAVTKANEMINKIKNVLINKSIAKKEEL